MCSQLLVCAPCKISLHKDNVKNVFEKKIQIWGDVEKSQQVCTQSSFSSPPPTSHKHQFYGVTSGFTRLNIKNNTTFVRHAKFYMTKSFSK